jgi:DNA-binding XRE family transcriptional regulator
MSDNTDISGVLKATFFTINRDKLYAQKSSILYLFLVEYIQLFAMLCAIIFGGIAMEFVGQRLRELREGVGLSQNKFAGMIGVRQSSINRYENGQSVPSIQTFRWYADYFDVSMDYIFGRTDKPQGKLYNYEP